MEQKELTKEEYAKLVEKERVERIKKIVQGVGTRDFLSTLDFDQLERAVEIAAEMIKNKDAEEMVSILLVSHDCGYVAGFRRDEYDKAVAAAHRLVDEQAERCLPFTVEVESVRKRISEVQEFLDLGTEYLQGK